MKFIRRASARERIKTVMVAGSIYWAGIALASFVIAWSAKGQLAVTDLFLVAGISLAGAIIFGVALALFHPLMAPPATDSDDGEAGRGVPARLIPPSPVLSATAIPESNEKITQPRESTLPAVTRAAWLTENV